MATTLNNSPHTHFSADDLRRIHQYAETVADRINLPFRNDTWQGQSGNWQGSGVGSSIDFQDHRPYQPGDDPRYINWQAYARTGQYSMKLYREEVSPRLDVVLDVSPSMFLGADKAKRTMELFYYTVSVALKSGAMLRIFTLTGSQSSYLELDPVLNYAWQPKDNDLSAEQAAPDFSRIPWRPKSMRVIISDCLYPGSPETLLQATGSAGCKLILFAPWSREEAEPDWLGNVELNDCESKKQIDRRFTQADIQNYQQQYQAHFALWQEACMKRGICMARVTSEGELSDSLLDEPLRNGAVELCN